MKTNVSQHLKQVARDRKRVGRANPVAKGHSSVHGNPDHKRGKMAANHKVQTSSNKVC